MPSELDFTSSSPTVIVIGGDGIGSEVVHEAVGVLEVAGFDGSFVEGQAGWDHWLETSSALPEHTIDLIKTHGLCLFGATTSQPPHVAESVAAERGLSVWISPILCLRRRLNLELSYRPVRSFPGNPGNVLIQSRGAIIEPVVDMVVVRQNTEGLYAGVEWRDPPEDVRAALASHPNWPSVGMEEVAITIRVVTRSAAARVVEAAFALAESRDEHEVVVAEKPNVIRATSGLFVEVAEEVAERHPGIEVVVMNIDAVLMEMVARPDRFGVIVTTNLFGDLLSDAAAGLVGGPGFVPSSNVGTAAAIFEPVHGSAPGIAGTGSANPVAAILAAAMLAEHCGLSEVAERIRAAVADAVLRGLPGTTSAIGRAVKAALAG